ncbi:MAG: N-acetylmuramoyl-L-alanine amidase [Gemmatimonadota bacterium]
MRRARFSAGFVALMAALTLPHAGAAQTAAPELLVEREDRSVERVPVSMARGYAGLSLGTLRSLGWTAQESDDRVSLSAGSRAELTFQLGSPFFRWGGTTLQLADAPFREGNEAYVPLQLVTDLFPERLPEFYEYDAGSSTLRAGDPGATVPRAGPAPDRATPALPEPTAPALDAPSFYDGVRVVWIDAGHGGADPGAIGPSGVREKDIALGIARKLARILGEEQKIEIRMTRDDDGFVDLWERGLLATDAKGERPGVFVSIHANSYPVRRTTRGFETYFLSEARTEDERRVSANENAPLTIRGRGVDPARQSDLDFILRELRNFDHQHWSALLAQMVQDELAKFHPGPNRGVKQGPLAVLTNAIMPSVLVEVGFVTNQEEANLMVQDHFQERAASGIANAVLRFLERYPPGNGLGGSR